MQQLLQLLLLLLLLAPASTHLTAVVLKDHKSCFFEVLEQTPTPSTVEVFVLKGGDLNIDLEVRGPVSLNDGGIPQADGGEVQLLRVVEPQLALGEDSDVHTFGKSFEYTLPAAKPGVYSFCFENRERLSPKHVHFHVRESNAQDASSDMTIDPAIFAQLQDKVDLSKLVESIRLLDKEFSIIESNQKRERKRLALRSAMNEESHRVMLLNSVIETGIFVAVSVFQAIFVRRWFGGKGSMLPSRGTRKL